MSDGESGLHPVSVIVIFDIVCGSVAGSSATAAAGDGIGTATVGATGDTGFTVGDWDG